MREIKHFLVLTAVLAVARFFIPDTIAGVVLFTIVTVLALFFTLSHYLNQKEPKE